MQAEISYIEAEAAVAALQAVGEDVVPPLEGGQPSTDTTGVRIPPDSLEQAQALVGAALERGMQLAHECHQPWAVRNGAIYAWNAYLPIMIRNR